MKEVLHFPQRNFGAGVNLDLDAFKQRGLHRGARGRNRRGEGILIGRIEAGEVVQVGEVSGAFDHIGERASGLIKDKPDMLQREFRFRLNSRTIGLLSLSPDHDPAPCSSPNTH